MTNGTPDVNAGAGTPDITGLGDGLSETEHAALDHTELTGVGTATSRHLHRSGLWYATPQGSVGTATFGVGDLRCTPFPVDDASITLDDMGVQVTSAGGAGSVCRVGVYQDDGTGYPGDLLFDAGTIDTTSTGTRTVAANGAGAISEVVTRGLYWLACVAQTSAPAQWMVRSHDGGGGLLAPVGAADVADIASGRTAWSQTGVSGALPATFTATAASVDVGHFVAVRLA